MSTGQDEEARPSSNSVAQAARRWVRRQSGSWSTADQIELDHWLASSPEHMRAYMEVERTWEELGGLSPNETGLLANFPKRSSRWNLVAVAATAALVTVMTVWWLVPPRPRQSDLLTSTVPKVFQLEDGTTIALDASSEVTIQMAGPIRRVYLQRGEAVIQTNPKGGHQLEVWAGHGRILDVGTRFDVEIVREKVRVSVYAGRVAIATARGGVNVGTGMSGGYSETGELLPVDNAGVEVSLAEDGHRHFDAVPLEVVAERLQRYHAIRIDFADSAARTLLVSGTFRLAALDRMLATLEKALPVHITRPAADRIVIQSSPIP